MERNVHRRRSEFIRKYIQRHEPVFGAAKAWNNNAVASIVYMIQHGYIDCNIDTDDIISLLYELDAEDYMYGPSTFHMREYYDLKAQIHDPDTPTYMEALSGENTEE